LRTMFQGGFSPHKAHRRDIDYSMVISTRTKKNKEK